MAEVMVVEDEDTTRLLIEARLHELGHVVRAAASLAEARAVLERSGPPEVLVSDMFMPGGSGLHLVAELRRDPSCADVPVIFLSGRALPGDVDAGRALGATYLTKPCTMPALTAAIDAALGARDDAVASQVRAHLADVTADGEELFAKVLTLFLEQAPAALAALERAMAHADAEGLEEAAHRLRGAALNLGVEPLARVCAELEEYARQGRFPVPGAVAATLRRQLELTCRVFGSLAAEPAGPGAMGSGAMGPGAAAED